jgi:hypothetical protein
VGHDRSEEGISNLGLMLSMAVLLVVVVIVAIGVAVTLPSSTTTTTTVASTVVNPGGPDLATSTTTPTTAPSISGTGAAAAVAACRSDVTVLETALTAYQATNGSYPTPPAAWAAASYPTNFAPLTNAPPPGPFLKMPPADNQFVIMWDSSGRIWVEPPGTFTPTYDASNDGTNPPTCTRVAR